MDLDEELKRDAEAEEKSVSADNRGALLIIAIAFAMLLGGYFYIKHKYAGGM